MTVRDPSVRPVSGRERSLALLFAVVLVSGGSWAFLVGLPTLMKTPREATWVELACGVWAGLVCWAAMLAALFASLAAVLVALMGMLTLIGWTFRVLVSPAAKPEGFEEDFP